MIPCRVSFVLLVLATFLLVEELNAIDEGEDGGDFEGLAGSARG